MAQPPREPTAPLDVDAVTVVTIGTAMWGLAAIGLALFARRWLSRHDDTWWVWTCLAGFGLGLIGILYVRRRRAGLARATGGSPPDAEPHQGEAPEVGAAPDQPDIR